MKKDDDTVDRQATQIPDDGSYQLDIQVSCREVRKFEGLNYKKIAQKVTEVNKMGVKDIRSV